MPGEPLSVRKPVVFISYAHESDAFDASVGALAEYLRAEGFEVVSDHQHTDTVPPKGWTAWMQHSIEEADFILVVCTPAMKAAFERRGGLKVRGATVESVFLVAAIRPRLIDNSSCFPLLPDGGAREHVPVLLEEFFNNHRFPSGQERILRLLRGPKGSSQEKPTAKSSDQFGRCVDVVVAAPHGQATQRFRWIDPGTFLMGSPEKEKDREPIEGPQHRVALTQGYWLADTACTQALWAAVTGRNPSEFKRDDLPVENVSWDEVQEFLATLDALLPGCGARLPTEAEWEHACRAGTTTPFWFGETIAPGQVNYDGNRPYAGGAKGEFRAKTISVKSLPANGWGLFQMHGNVWEWCRDGRRGYTAADAVDPKGPEGGDRVVRGGSWYANASRARSAYRFAIQPDYRIGTLGFRLLLRSIGPVPQRAV